MRRTAANWPAPAAACDAEKLGRRLLPSGAGARELARKRPLRALADVATCYAAIVLALAMLAAHPTWWTALAAFVVIGNRQYALSVLSHEGGHRKLFAGRRANDLFTEILLCAPVGIDFRRERSGHNEHHRQLARADDPDRYLYSAGDKATPARFAFFLTGLSMFPHAIEQALRGRGAVAAEPFSLGRFLACRAPTFAVQLGVLAAIAAFFPWWYYLAFWIAPMYPMLFVPHQIRRFCEHAQPVTPDDAADDRRLVTFDTSALERLFLAPYNINYHAEHHLWPFVPYYNMPRLRPLLAAGADVDHRPSYAGFLLGFARRLPLPSAAAAPLAARRAGLSG